MSHVAYYKEVIGSLFNYLDTYLAHIQLSIFNRQIIQVDSLFRLQGSFICIYFYLRGCMSGFYLELDLSDHRGIFAVGFLAKNNTRWTTHLDQSAQLIRRWFLVVELYDAWTPVACLCGRLILQGFILHICHIRHASTSSTVLDIIFDSPSLYCYIFTLTPRGLAYPCTMTHCTSLYILFGHLIS